MVGNDVVDLRDSDADLDSYSPRFARRVFTSRERLVIASDPDPVRCHWRFWAAKEAVYKVLRKREPRSVFSPRLLEVAMQPGEPHEARVVDRSAPAPGGRFSVRFFDEPSAVHAVTAFPKWNAARVVHGFACNGDAHGDGMTPGHAVRHLACRKIASALGLEASDLEVRKQGRIPVLLDRGHPVQGNLSLSHHGAWTGFAFGWDPQAEAVSS